MTILQEVIITKTKILESRSYGMDLFPVFYVSVLVVPHFEM